MTGPVERPADPSKGGESFQYGPPGGAPSTLSTVTSDGTSLFVNGAPLSVVGGSTGLAWTAVKTGAYSAAANDSIPVDTTTGTFAVTLAALATNAKVRVKWIAGATPPTIAAGAGATVDPTWPGFGAVGDVVEFSQDASAVWRLV